MEGLCYCRYEVTNDGSDIGEVGQRKGVGLKNGAVRLVHLKQAYGEVNQGYTEVRMYSMLCGKGSC